MGIKNWVRQRVTLVAGQAQIYEPKSKSTNALYIVNNNAADVKVAAWSDVANIPEATIKANSNGPIPLSSPGESVYLYSASAMTVIVVEITTDDLSVVFAMQVVVSDISTALDVSDRAGRAVGKVGLQVGGADVAGGNPVPVNGNVGISGSSIPDSQPVPIKTKEALRWIVATDTGNVAVSTVDDVLIYASAGKIARVIACELQAAAVAGATTGSHYFAFQSPASDSNYFPMLYGGNAYNAAVYFAYNHFYTTSGARPSDIAAQVEVLHGVEFDATLGLRIRYYNGTDAVQTGDRTIRILVAERSVA